MNGKWLTTCCLLIAIALKAALCYHFFQFETDKSYQAIAAMNLVEGNGLTIAKADVTDLPRIQYEPVIGWPPGYSLFIAFFYGIIGDLKGASLLTDVLGTVMFMIGLYWLLRKLKFNPLLMSILVLFNGALMTDNIYLSTPTDLFCVSFILFALTLYIDVFEKTTKSYKAVVFLTFVNFLPALFRFMYLPVVWVIPLLILWNGLYNHDRNKLHHGLFSMLLTVILVATLLIYQATTTGALTFSVLNDTPAGLNWDTISALHPIAIASFVNLNFFTWQLSGITGISYESWQNALRIINLAILPFVLLYLLVFILKKRGIPVARWEIFFIASAAISIIAFCVVVYASLSTVSQMAYPFEREWTFVTEGRYFLVMMLLLPIYAGRFLFEVPTGNKWKNIVRIGFTCTLLLEVLHTGYFLVNEFEPGNHSQANLYVKKSTELFIKRTITEQQQAGLEVVFSSDHGTICNYAAMYGAKAVYAPHLLNTVMMNSSTNAVLYLLVTERMSGQYRQFIEREGVTYLGKQDFLRVYVFNIPTNK